MKDSETILKLETLLFKLETQILAERKRLL
jgi:hypothetical protein